MIGSNNDVFGMLSTEDKLDRNNYWLWAYMMQYVFLTKGISRSSCKTNFVETGDVINYARDLAMILPQLFFPMLVRLVGML